MVSTLNLINAELNGFELSKLFYKIYNPKIDVEFLDDEIDSINKCIRANDVDSITHIFESKEAIRQDVFEDMIYSKTDSIVQSVIDHINNMQQPININLLSDYEKTAFLFGELDYKIKHDDLRKWAEGLDDDSTYLDIDCLYNHVINSTFEDKDEFLDILSEIDKVKRSINNLDYSSLWYNEDKEVRLNSLKNCEQRYFNIEKRWGEYLERYLLDNMPEDYLSIIMNNELPKGL